MANYIKTGTTSLNVAERAAFKIGVDDADIYGPTNITGFYKGITPPVGGFTIYMTKDSQGPSIHVAHNDEECIFFLKSFGATGSTISDVLAWSDAQTNVWTTSSDLTKADINPNLSVNYLLIQNGNRLKAQNNNTIIIP